MSRSKTSKQASLTSVVAGVVLTAFLGILVGFIYEVSQEPQIVLSGNKATVSKDSPSPIVRMGGANSTTNYTQVLRTARQSASNGNPLSLGVGDLNRISDEYLNFTAGKQQSSTGDNPFFGILPDTPNFNIFDEKFQAVIPFEFFYFGIRTQAILVLIGQFEEGKNEPSYKVQEAWINSARIPSLLAGQILNRLVAAAQGTLNETLLLAAWSNLESIRVAGDQLILDPR